MKSVLIDKAERNTPIFIDSSVFIYLFEDYPRYVGFLETFFNELSSGAYSSVSSIITVTEVLTKPYEENQIELIKKYSDIFYHLPHFSLVAPTHQTAVEAAKIKAEYKFHLLDSFQLALAHENNCKSFLTNDKQLMKYKKLHIFYLDNFTEK